MPSVNAPLPNSKRWRNQSGICTFICDEPSAKSAAATAMKVSPIENNTWSRCGRPYMRRYSMRSSSAPNSAVAPNAIGRQARKGQPARCINSTST